MRRLILVLVLAVGSALALSACGSGASKTSDYQKVQRIANARHAYIPRNNVEFNNYNGAQRLYDSPSTIIWCTTTWGNPSAPMVTIPVAGKLTSSSVSYFPNQQIDNSSDDTYNPDLRSVDGMFHGSPPPYRYGFTPGGQYIDFANMPTLCTTAMTKFQRQSTKVDLTIDRGAENATQAAEAALKAGTQANGQVTGQAKAQAQRILEGAGLGG